MGTAETASSAVRLRDYLGGMSMAYTSEEDEQDSIEADAQAAVARYPSIREAYEAVLANRAQYHEQDSMWQYWDDVSRAI